MSLTGWTSFCRTGHIVDQCPPGKFLPTPRKRCHHCHEEIIGNIPGWGDGSAVPILPVNIDKNDLAVYDVERLRIFADK
jgi:hypothetical protein